MIRAADRQLPEGLVDVNRCIAEAQELRWQAWQDRPARRFGLRMLALKFAALGLAAAAVATIAPQLRQGTVEAANSRPVVAHSVELMAAGLVSAIVSELNPGAMPQALRLDSDDAAPPTMAGAHKRVSHPKSP